MTSCGVTPSTLYKTQKGQELVFKAGATRAIAGGMFVKFDKKAVTPN